MRYYAETTKDEFLAKVGKLMNHDDFPYDKLPRHIQRDLHKVQFDWENYTPFNTTNGYCTYPVGHREVAPGFHIFFVNAGGDWEWPICFIFYWSCEKRIRAYIPEDGNAYNKKEKIAYGSDSSEESGDENHDSEISEERMIAEILGHIKPTGAADRIPVEDAGYCCNEMKERVEHRCEQHENPFECPDNILHHSEKRGEYGIIIHDGGPSYIVINYCPFCGRKLK